MKTTASLASRHRKCIGQLRRAIGLACYLTLSLVATAIAQPNAEPGPPVPPNLSAAPIGAPAAHVTTAGGVAVSVRLEPSDRLPVHKCTDAAYEFWGRLAWPLTVLILGGVLLLNQKWLRILIRSLRKVKAGDVEFEFNAQDALRAKISIDEAYEEFRKTAQVAYAHFVRVYSIKERFEKAVITVREKATGTAKKIGGAVAWPNDFRATVHVPDVVLSEFTYQLLDYLPRGGGGGRRFSSRRGILGRCWRLERSLGMGDALVPSSAPDAKPGDDEEAALIQKWGMTRAEAASWRQDKRHSFLCIILRSPEVNGSPGIAVGVLYIDSTTINGFGTDEQATEIAKWAQSQPTVRELGEAVNQALQDLRKGGTFLDFSQ